MPLGGHRAVQYWVIHGGRTFIYPGLIMPRSHGTKYTGIYIYSIDYTYFSNIYIFRWSPDACKSPTHPAASYMYDLISGFKCVHGHADQMTSVEHKVDDNARITCDCVLSANHACLLYVK